MGGSTVLEGVNDRADMIETQKTFTLLGERKYSIPGVAIFSKNGDAQHACVLKTSNQFQV